RRKDQFRTALAANDDVWTYLGVGADHHVIADSQEWSIEYAHTGRPVNEPSHLRAPQPEPGGIKPWHQPNRLLKHRKPIEQHLPLGGVPPAKKSTGGRTITLASEPCIGPQQPHAERRKQIDTG